MTDRAESAHLEVTRTARYWTLGPDGSNRTGTLYALHGYGQLAEYFIRKFQPLADEGWRVVAPEGGHRFYLQGTEGRVGASWMTREDRLLDIKDYVLFLDQLRSAMGHAVEGPDVMLGFSQGVATAMRWMALGARGADSWQGAIAHSGVIPPDLPGEGTVGGVVLGQVGIGVGIAEVVDGNDLDFAGAPALVERAQDVAADAAVAVDCDFDRHALSPSLSVGASMPPPPRAVQQGSKNT